MTRTATQALFAAFAISLVAGSAHAGEIALERELQGASLHDGGIDMVVYYLDREDHLEVVATYATAEVPEAPARLRMGLMDGDEVSFALPGERHVQYSFARDGQTVRVEARATNREVAQAMTE
ncbi:MAG: hypothetical protein AAFX62_14530 [Pseudomonadota bacterium]